METGWLLEPKTFEKMQKAEMPSAEILAGLAQNDLPDGMSIVGNTAIINIKGILTDERDFWAMFFFGGNTVYSGIIESVKAAEADSNVKNIQFNVDSPGGMASAQWIEAMDVIAASSKPTKAMVGTMAASAAYGLASQADEIIAQNRMSLVGSIGVITTRLNIDELVDITSTKAPKKAPDVSTEAGKKIIREHLDAVHDIFVTAIALGRDTTVDNVNSNFGQGAILIAQDAIKRGMIDKIGIDSSENNTNKNPMEANMDLATLKKDHPDLYAQVLAEGVEQGKEAAANTERERATAHLKMGKESGAVDYSIEAVMDGEAFGSVLSTQKYMSARLDKNDIDNRAEETENLETETSTEENDNAASAVADAVEIAMGVGGTK